MKIRKTISIDSNDLKALKPFLDASGDNLSLALRKLIESYNEQKSMSSISGAAQQKMMIRNQIIENRIAELIPVPLVKWFNKTSTGIPPLGTFRQIIEKFPKLLGIERITIQEYIRMISTYDELFGYKIKQHVESNQDFKNIKISYEGENPDDLKGTVVNYSCMLAHNPFELKINTILKSPNLFIVEYQQCSSEEEAYKSVKDHFGYAWSIQEEIQRNASLWNNIACILKTDNYENVIINREILLNILRCTEFSYQLNNLISNIYGVSLEEAEYHHFLKMMEEVLTANGLIQKIEYNKNEIKIYHKFEDKNIINTLNETFFKTLEISGSLFDIKKNSKITILNRKA